MHQFPLHRHVVVECACCHLEQTFCFKSSSDHVICLSCIRHQGDNTAKANQRAYDHTNLWKSELAVAREDHADRVAELQKQIEFHEQEAVQLHTELNQAKENIRLGLNELSLPEVEKWWTSEQVQDANNKRDSAYRSRDAAFRALWGVAELHVEDRDKKYHCTCGKTVHKCKEYNAIAGSIQALLKWENAQLDRLKQDLDHGLPDNHPEVLKRGLGRRRYHSQAG